MRPMSLILCLFLGAALVNGSGCNRRDTDKLANIGKIVADRTQTALHDVRAEHFPDQNATAVLDVQGLARRVQMRLETDKELCGAAIEATLAGEAIELKGHVADLTQRRRAVELAETTVGVTKVKDSLQTGQGE